MWKSADKNATEIQIFIVGLLCMREAFCFDSRQKKTFPAELCALCSRNEKINFKA
jgi:hypothetical protein